MIAINDHAGVRLTGRVSVQWQSRQIHSTQPVPLGEGYITSIADAIIPAVDAAATKLDPAELRRQRGLIIAALCYIRPDGKANRYLVPSQTGAAQYLVCIDPKKGPGWRCDCKDYEARQLPCKHIHAVRFVIDREKKSDVPPPGRTTLAVELKAELSAQASPERPTYKQNWTAYNAAQTTEKHRVQVLLADLCRGVVEPPKPHGGAKGGRPPVPMADRVFAAAFKVYSTTSGRRFTCDMKDAESRGYVSHAPHFNSISRFLESPELTPVLGNLIRQSALPLRAVEVDFAVDATGFGTSRFVRWFDKKYGIVRQRAEFVKVSVMTGVKTNIVTAFRIGGQYSGDSPDFVPMVKETAESFAIREVSADKAYCSYDNFDAVAGLGGTAYIAFMTTATGRLGGTYGKMFHLYNLNQDEYLAHYHKRSNVESTFSMIKAKFGDAVRSKTDVAMMNEALCKVLCHDLCCLIQSTHELGIEAKFWLEGDSGSAHAAELSFDEVGAWDWI